MSAVISFAALLFGIIYFCAVVSGVRSHLRTFGSSVPLPNRYGWGGVGSMVLICIGVVGLAIAAVTQA